MLLLTQMLLQVNFPSRALHRLSVKGARPESLHVHVGLLVDRATRFIDSVHTSVYRGAKARHSFRFPRLD